MIRRPPNLLVTTPESLYLYLTAERSRATLETVETVIVDEIHALARDKRGSHLTLSLERLQAVTERSPVRIGLSATVRPVETAARLLVGVQEPLPTVVDSGHRRRLELSLEMPDGELEAALSGDQFGEIVDRIAGHVAQAPHHAGLRQHQEAVRAGRTRAGRAARRGPGGRPPRVAVARAPPEGRAPPAGRRPAGAGGHRLAGARHRRRAGRAGVPDRLAPQHRHLPAASRAAPTTTAPVSPAGSCSRPPATSWSNAPRCWLRSIAAASTRSTRPSSHSTSSPSRSWPRRPPGATTAWPRTSCSTSSRGPGRTAELTREEFEEVVELVSTGIETGRGRRMAYLHRDRVNGRVRGRRGARLATLTSGGAIPETGDYRVLMEPGDVFIGTVNEDFAIESFQGDVFLLGTHPWQIVQVTNGVMRVRDATGRHPTIPFWVGEAPGPHGRAVGGGLPAADRGRRAARRRRAGGRDRTRAGDVGRRRSGRRPGRRLSGGRPDRARRSDADSRRHRVRAVLRRDRRHAADRPCPAGRQGQPGARPRAAEEVLPQLRLRAPGGGQQRRRAAVARPPALVPARGRAGLPALPQRAGRGRPRRCSAARCSQPAGAGTSTGRSPCCAARAAASTRSTSSAWRRTT